MATNTILRGKKVNPFHLSRQNMQPFLPHLSAPENADFKLHVCQLQLPLHHLPSASSLGSMGNLIFWILKPGMHLRKLRLSIGLLRFCMASNSFVRSFPRNDALIVAFSSPYYQILTIKRYLQKCRCWNGP